MNATSAPARARIRAALTAAGTCACDPTAGDSCQHCDGTRDVWAADRRAAEQDCWEDSYRARHGHGYAIGGLPRCPVCRPPLRERDGAAP